MTLVVCVDDRMGMAFGGRRQSRDSALCRDLAELASGCTIRMDTRSQKLFDVVDCRIKAEENFVSAAETDDVCFLEFSAAEPAAEKADRIVLYRWNRHYPADLHFTVNLQAWKLAETKEFPGTSHEKITREVYLRE